MTDTAVAATPVEPAKPTKSRRGRRILGLVLIVLLLLLAAAAYLFIRLTATPGDRSGVDTGGLEWVRSIYGMSDAPADQLTLAQAAVTAPDGSIWVTDANHQSLMNFTADGRYQRTYKGPADTPLFSPSRFAIDADGTFYIAETTLDSVRVLDSDGQESGSFGIPQPVSVAVAGDRVVVGSVSGFAILDRTGKPLQIIGSRGKGDQQFDYVHGVAIGANGNVYVADSFNNRLSAYDRNGKRLWIVRTGKPANSAEFDAKAGLTVEEAKNQQLKGEDALQLPLGMTIDGAGRVVVIDMFDSTLAVFDPADGKLIGKYGEIGAEDGQFFYPASVTYNAAHDWFTVADQLNNRVQIIRLPGSAAGNGAVAGIRRAFTGPLRACIFPFLLIVLATIAWLVYRAVRKRREANDALPAPAEEAVENVVDLEADPEVG